MRSYKSKINYNNIQITEFKTYVPGDHSIKSKIIKRFSLVFLKNISLMHI